MDLNFTFSVIQPTIAKQPSILAIDDDEDNLMILSYILGAMGYPSLTATRGDEGLLIAQTRELSLILLDILLPGLNGFEIIHHLKGNSSTKDIPIIAITGLAFPEDKYRLLEAGCDAYLSKPYLIEDLENLIYYYLKPKISLSGSSRMANHKN